MVAPAPSFLYVLAYSMTGFLPNSVILATPVITAIGCDDWGDGNPEEQRQPPVGHLHINNKGK